MGISPKIASHLARSSWIRRMFEEGEKLRSLFGPDRVFDFTLGNPTTEPPERFGEELRNLANKPVPGMHRYMNNAGYYETRQSVADTISYETGLPCKARHIVMTCGAGGALNVVLKTILSPGDEVVVSVPYFMEYTFYADNHGGVIVEVPSGRNFMIDPNAIAEAVTPKTKAVIINSPNNPTGVVYTRDVLENLGKLISEKSHHYKNTIYIISDEPYAKITYDGVRPPQIFNIYESSIVVNSYSKDLALPGERIGYIAVNPRTEDAEQLVDGMTFCNRILGFVNAPALMQRLVAVLQGVTVDIQEYREKRDLLYDNLTTMGFEMIKPQGAFYLFPKSPLKDDLQFVDVAKKHNILVVPGSGFGMAGYFRLSYCVEKETIINSLPAFRSLARETGLKG